MDALAKAILAEEDIHIDEVLGKHADWVEEFLPKYEAASRDTKEKLMKIFQKEIGDIFMQVLEDAGVYKRTPEGRLAFDRFISTL